MAAPTAAGLVVFGGTFDPVHVGHLAIARAASAGLGGARVVFVPARVPPHKDWAASIPDAARLELLGAALADDPCLAVSNVELARPAPSYAIDTVRQLAAGGSGELFWLLGADLVAGLPSWREWLALAGLVTFLVAPRGDGDAPFPAGARCRELVLPRCDVSSTEIRRRLAAGASVAGMVPEPALAIILERGYYRAS